MFKVGDRVVITHKLDGNDLDAGTSATVSEVLELTDGYILKEHEACGYISIQLELEEIWNSPLYQAMKEND